MEYCLYHHGVKGQKWGIRRYQYADGTLTPAGKKRYRAISNATGLKRSARLMRMRVGELKNSAQTAITGKQYVDGYLKQGTTLSRIQTSSKFEKFAFYATYKKHDTDEYMGLFGKNLTDRAVKQGLSPDEVKVYQLKLEATKKLKIPSDKNASDITSNLLKEEEFKKNVIASLQDSKEKMRRPTQQIIFDQALNVVNKDPDRMSSMDKVAIYKAFNLSLVNHNAQEVAAQNRFYSELKKKGYNALLDYNDKEFSSYHAKRPMIVFDTDSVKLQSITETNPKVVDKLYSKYNTERIIKEIPAETIGLVSKFGTKTISECRNYVDERLNDYLSS